MEDMASVHLSISKHSQLSSLSTGGEVISFLPLHHRPLLISAFPFCSSLFSRLIYLLPTSAFIPFPFSFYLFFSSILPLFLSHFTLLLSIPSSASPALSVEQPIQQQNKAAHSITHWLIKQDQNAAALTSTQHHHDTGQHWRGEVCHIRRRGSREAEQVEENKREQDNIT